VRIRGIVGTLLSLSGIVWIRLGVNVLPGSMMSGHGGYSVLGAAALVLGLSARAWARRRASARG
jgi:hypothetical protein